MLDLNALQHTRERAAVAHTTRHRFALCGVAFEVLVADGAKWELPEAYRLACTSLDETTVVADVLCSVRRRVGSDARGEGASRLALPVAAAERELCMTSERMRVEISALGTRRYAASALIEAGDTSAAELLLSLICAVMRFIASETATPGDAARSQLITNLSDSLVRARLHAVLGDDVELCVAQWLPRAHARS